MKQNARFNRFNNQPATSDPDRPNLKRQVHALKGMSANSALTKCGVYTLGTDSSVITTFAAGVTCKICAKIVATEGKTESE